MRLFFCFSTCINTALKKYNEETKKWIKLIQKYILQDSIGQLSHRKPLTDPLEIKDNLTVKP